MTKSEELLSQQLDKLQDELNRVKTDLSGLSAGCAVRHRINLTAEITRLETEIHNLRSQLNVMLSSVNDNISEITTLKNELNDVKGKVNILMIKTDDLIFDKTKSKDNRYYFITQILIIVFAFIITGVLGFISSSIWSSLGSKNNKKSVEIVQKQ